MATTSIWPINGNILQVINYISSASKTENPAWAELDIHSLRSAAKPVENNNEAMCTYSSRYKPLTESFWQH